MLDFRLLRHFCAIVTEGQISRAAQSLHISQPTLSLSLKELEEEIGLPLINRAAGKFQVTEQGRLFYQEARRILTQLEDLSEKIRSPYVGSPYLFGEVRLGCAGFCTSFVRAILPTLAADYPGIRVRLLLGDNITLENWIHKERLDLAIIQLPFVFGDCESVPFPEQHFVSCWSPLLPVPPEGPASLSRIASHPLIVGRRWSNVGGTRPFIIAMQEAGLQPKIIMDTPFANLIPGFLKTVPAIGIIPNNEISPESSKEMPVRELETRTLHFRSAVIWQKDMLLSPPIKKVVELLTGTPLAEK